MNAYPEFEGYFVENDVMMLRDIQGLSLKRALRKVFFYIPYAYRTFDWGYYERSKYSPFHFLLAFAKKAREEDTILECCVNRLAILLENDCNPQHVMIPWTSFDEVYNTLKTLSVTEFAQIHNVLDLWNSSLEVAGWSDSRIQDLVDESVYAGIPELLQGELEFTTISEQRRDYIAALRSGGFGGLEEHEMETLCQTKLQYELKIGGWGIDFMIQEVDSIIKQRATPGSWSESEGIKLIPGVDFPIYSGMEDWMCVREVWNNELGHIPQRKSSESWGGSYYV